MASGIIRYRNLVLAIRKLMGDTYSQTSFAKVLGTKQPVVSDWLSGKTWPSEESRRKLAKLRGQTLDQFDDYLNGDKVEASILPETAKEALSMLVQLD